MDIVITIGIFLVVLVLLSATYNIVKGEMDDKHQRRLMRTLMNMSEEEQDKYLKLVKKIDKWSKQNIQKLANNLNK